MTIEVYGPIHPTEVCPTCGGPALLRERCRCAYYCIKCPEGHGWHTCPVHKVQVAADPHERRISGCTCKLGIRMKQVFVIRKDLELSGGKLGSQIGHACLGSYRDAVRRIGAEQVEIWWDNGQKKVTLKVRSLGGLLRLAERAEELGLPHYLVEDAGRTEIAPGTPTALGVGPDLSDRVNKLTGKLSVY